MSNQIEKVEGRLVTPMERKQPKTLHPLKLANGEVTYQAISLQVVSVTSGHLAAPAPRSAHITRATLITSRPSHFLKSS